MHGGRVPSAARYVRSWGQARAKRRTLWDHVASVCWIAGTAALLWVGLSYASAWQFQFRAAKRLETLIRSGGAKEAVARPHPGDLLGVLEIPRIGLSTVVVEGTDDRDLLRAVGHIPGTALPSGAGNVGLAGHRDTWFRNLGRLRQNDVIVLRLPGDTYRYRIIGSAIVNPENVSVLLPMHEPTLTLVTCYPFRYVGPAPRRYVVTALREDSLSSPGLVK